MSERLRSKVGLKRRFKLALLLERRTPWTGPRATGAARGLSPASRSPNDAVLRPVAARPEAAKGRPLRADEGALEGGTPTRSGQRGEPSDV